MVTVQPFPMRSYSVRNLGGAGDDDIKRVGPLALQRLCDGGMSRNGAGVH
jgi:hypothetical protein